MAYLGKNLIKKNPISESARPRPLIFVMLHCLKVL